MAGLDKIIDEILGEAKIKANQTTDAAKKEADRIISEAQARAKSESEAISKKPQSESQTLDERAKSSADMQKRQAYLKARQEVISEIIEAAYEKVMNSDIDTYFDLIVRILESAVLPKDGKIILSEKDKSRMPAGFTQKVTKIAKDKGGTLTLSEESAVIDGGFILTYGGIEENCSIRALFNSKQDELVDIVNSVVFEDSAAQ